MLVFILLIEIDVNCQSPLKGNETCQGTNMSAGEMCFPTGMQQNWSKQLKYLSFITPASLRNNYSDIVHEFTKRTAKCDIFVSKSLENTCFIKVISTGARTLGRTALGFVEENCLSF